MLRLVITIGESKIAMVCLDSTNPPPMEAPENSAVRHPNRYRRSVRHPRVRESPLASSSATTTAAVPTATSGRRGSPVNAMARNAAKGACEVMNRAVREAPMMPMEMKPAVRPMAKWTTPNATTQGSAAQGTLMRSENATAIPNSSVIRNPTTRDTPVAVTQ